MYTVRRSPVSPSPPNPRFRHLLSAATTLKIMGGGHVAGDDAQLIQMPGPQRSSMAHDDALHKQAVDRGDYADETLYDRDSITASLIHFADGSHAVRLDLPDRGLSIVVDTPAWLDL